MQDINPQGFSNPVLSAATSGDVEAAQQNMISAFANAAQLLADRGVRKNVAVLFQADPLSAEIGLRENLFHLGRSTLSGAFESLDFGPSVEVEGKKYTKAEPTTGHAITTLGSVEYQRPRYRATNRQGESFIPAEHLLGLTEGNVTPAAASLSMALLSSLTARESADYWKRFVGEGPSTGTLVRLSGEAGRSLEERSTEVTDKLRKQEKLPEGATMVHMGLDGVMMRMTDEKNGDEVIEEAGWREASCGVVTVRDDDGNRLQSRYIGRLPEGKKTPPRPKWRSSN